jgi:hypothetical protein
MCSEPITVPPFVDLQQWVEDYVFRYHHKAFPVASDGHLEGLIDTQALAKGAVALAAGAASVLRGRVSGAVSCY